MKKLIIIASIIVLSLSSYSQDSLSYYLELAAKNNPTVLQRYSEYEASLQKIPQVGSLPDPELSAGIFLSPMELVGGNQLADIRLMQMFPWFGVLKNAKDEMSLMAKAKFELFRDAKLQLCFDVQQTWYELYKVQKAISASEQNLEILKTIERIALVRFKAAASGISPTTSGGSMQSAVSTSLSAPRGSSGMTTMGGSSGNGQAAGTSQSAAPMQGTSGGSGLADLYRIQMEEAELTNSISLLKDQLNTVTARFNSYLNRPAQLIVTIPDTIKSAVLNIPILAVADSLTANNPMLGMLNYEKKSLEARKQMVSRMGYPMVGLGVNYSLINKNPMSTAAMNGKDMIMPMVTVTLPIYQKKYNAMQKEADFMQHATSQGIQATSNSLQTEFYEELQSYQDAKRRKELYSHQLQLASQSLNILIKGFSSSGTGLTELLRVHQQTLDYQLKQIDATADFNTSIAKMRRLGNFE